MLNSGWSCQFLQEDLKTPQSRRVTLNNPAKIIEMAERGGGRKNLEAGQALRHGIEIGRGGVSLNLKEEQCLKLKKR